MYLCYDQNNNTFSIKLEIDQLYKRFFSDIKTDPVYSVDTKRLVLIINFNERLYTFYDIIFIVLYINQKRTNF